MSLGSASSSLKPPAPKTVLKNFVNSETSESSSSSDSESPLPTPKILSKMPARQPDKVKGIDYLKVLISFLTDMV